MVEVDIIVQQKLQSLISGHGEGTRGDVIVKMGSRSIVLQIKDLDIVVVTII